MANADSYRPGSPGGSTWNGHYGDDEMARRAGYDRAQTPHQPRIGVPPILEDHTGKSAGGTVPVQKPV